MFVFVKYFVAPRVSFTQDDDVLNLKKKKEKKKGQILQSSLLKID